MKDSQCKAKQFLTVNRLEKLPDSRKFTKPEYYNNIHTGHNTYHPNGNKRTVKELKQWVSGFQKESSANYYLKMYGKVSI